MNQQIDHSTRDITVSLTTCVYEPLLLTHSSVQSVEQILLIPSLNFIPLHTSRTKGYVPNRLNNPGAIVVWSCSIVPSAYYGTFESILSYGIVF